MPYFFSFIAALNFSSSQSQTPLPDNHTIQNFVEDYVEEYVSKSIVELTPYDYTNFSWFALIFGQAYVFYNCIISFEADNTYYYFVSGGLNLSLAQEQPQSPDNRTIQTVVKAYLEEFIGRCTQEKMK